MTAIGNEDETNVENFLSSVDATTRKTILDTAVNEAHETPLYKACQTGNINIVNHLIHHGVDVNQQTGDKHQTPGDTALIYSSYKGQLQMVQTLLKDGADVSITRKDGCHATYCAAMYTLQFFQEIVKHDSRFVDRKGYNLSLIHI